MQKKRSIVVPLFMFGALIFSACANLPKTPTPTATKSFEELSTSVAATVIAQITESAPTITQTPTMTDTPAFTNTPLITNTPTKPTPTGCANLKFVSDVSIPDGTILPVGQTFTKTWKVENIGTCQWTTAFRLAYSYGDAMGGTTSAIPAVVAVGQQVDLSVNLKVPNKSGKLTGVWTLLDDKSQPFGPLLTVVINIGVVSPTPTGTVTATPEVTETPTLTATP